MATPHMMADAAAAGRALPSQWLAYRAESVSHFRLDLVRHTDFCALSGVEHSGPMCLEAAAGITDFLVGTLVVGLVAARQPGRRVMVGGALWGILLDVAEYVPPFGAWFQNWVGTAWLAGLHHHIQHNVTPAHWGLGSATQIAALGLGIAVCLGGTKSTRRIAGARAASV
jgi:hypothetical protein